MPDPIARKRLKKRMLDRWENEGGRIAPETTSEDAIVLKSKGKPGRKKLYSQRDTSTGGSPPSPIKSRKPTRK